MPEGDIFMGLLEGEIANGKKKCFCVQLSRDERKTNWGEGLCEPRVSRVL